MAVATETVTGYTMRPASHMHAANTGSRSNNHLNRERDQTEVSNGVTSPNSRHVSALPPARNAAFPRSASYSYIPGAHKDARACHNPAIVTIKGSFSEADLIAPADELSDISPPDSSGWTTPDEVFEPKVPVEQARDLIAELQKSPKISVGRSAKSAEDEEEAGEDDRRSSVESSARQSYASSTSVETSRTGSTPASTPGSVTPRPRASMQSSFSHRVSRQSCYSSVPSTTSSRSPSPAKEEVVRPYQVGKDAAPAPAPVSALSRGKSLLRRKTDPGKTPKPSKSVVKEASQDSGEERQITRKPTLLRRKSSRTSLFRGSTGENAAPDGVPPVPKVPAMLKSFSSDKLLTYRTVIDRAAPVPRLLSSDRVPSGGVSMPIRKRDELWSAFRGLDGDYTKFVSKSLAFKATVVRNTLLPFLRTYAAHPSNHNLRPEDLDRRASILNKWWTGMIEMLHGRNNQSISGTDRPAILDGISGVMERPEWRLAPSPFCPLNDRMNGMNTPRSRSITSISSGASEFLVESVHHNVRNIFVQNLSSQMAFVVDKMSLRNASASLVAFCGKASAYAFMFVPGMADVLVRLWDLQSDTLRRVLDGYGIGKFDNLTETSASVVYSFPPALHQLGFASLMKYMRKLRTPPPLPLGTANIQWWGHWLERWSGRESDLFYVFTKHFHILATDFLPEDPSNNERMCAPGMLLVHAQILTNLDATIHRDANQKSQDPTAVGPSPTFDDVLGDPDAVATALPLPPVNAIRTMAENRLIMLIRDFLSDRNPDHPIARRLFAESFNDLLQTAAKGTSLFDHAACYTLLDFLEEALPILVRFEHMKESKGPLLNSAFWQAVCKKMISSQNTMTEIRLYAFLYAVWTPVVCDLGRKADLCVGLLLDPEVFESRFNHWCPMVRAYYMRLLCWRVGRFDGEAQEGDIMILETMLERLQSSWSSHLYLREQAEKSGNLPPPTNPCNPAPGRRLLIIRTDTQLAPASSFLSFDGLGPRETPSSHAQLQSKRFSTLSHLVEVDSRPETSNPIIDADEPTETRGRGLGGFLRKMMGTSRNRSKSQGPPLRQRDSARAASAEALARPAEPLPERPTNHLTRASTDDGRHNTRFCRSSPSDLTNPSSQFPNPTRPHGPHRNFCFKFNLEHNPNNLTKHVPGPLRLLPPRLPLPAQLFLQAHSERAAGASTFATPCEPRGTMQGHARYAGRALAEWAVVVGECQSFFDRRRHEGVPGNRAVETPVLGVEVFRRPS
ncbi:hypothetical protein B0A50_03864 [Salinomyces thailandicus]|uniref:DUF1765-domain-containing protein n=1 Tax=Salinomyces thailandicus TaxID=706561 RepID=A0A4U0U0U5_9PEZI|nr:hypothetical protein B0A50_03864 [Salinomyces thailandica]